MLQDGPVLLLEDVLQILPLVVSYPPHVGVESGFPRAVAHLSRELREILSIIAELITIEAFQPSLSTYLTQV
jgi:hypothetical protein